MTLALLRRSIRRAAGLVAAVTLVVVGFQFTLVAVASSLYATSNFSQLSAFVPSVFRQMGAMMFASFAGLTAFGFVHPVTMLLVIGATIYVASEPAWEVETGIVDLTLARPVSRNALFARSMLMVVAAPLLVAALMVVAIRVALPMFAPAGAPWPPLRTSLLLAVNLVAVCWWFGASALLVASAARRRTIAAGTVLLAAAVLYLVNLVAEIWAPLRALALVSPFHYFNAPSLVTGNDERVLRNLAVLIGTAVIPTALGFWRFNRRDC